MRPVTDDKYLQALTLFPRIVVFANGINDLTVPYATAAISDHDPFIDHVRAALRVELEGKTIKRYYTPDPEEDEVEQLIAPDKSTAAQTAVVSDRPMFPPFFYTNWRGPLRYALFPFIPLLLTIALTIL